MAKLDRAKLVQEWLSQLQSPLVNPDMVAVMTDGEEISFAFQIGGMMMKTQPLASPGYDFGEMYSVASEVRDLFHEAKGVKPEDLPS